MLVQNVPQKSKMFPDHWSRWSRFLGFNISHLQRIQYKPLAWAGYNHKCGSKLALYLSLQKCITAVGYMEPVQKGSLLQGLLNSGQLERGHFGASLVCDWLSSANFMYERLHPKRLTTYPVCWTNYCAVCTASFLPNLATKMSPSKTAFQPCVKLLGWICVSRG